MYTVRRWVIGLTETTSSYAFCKRPSNLRASAPSAAVSCNEHNRKMYICHLCKNKNETQRPCTGLQADLERSLRARVDALQSEAEDSAAGNCDEDGVGARFDLLQAVAAAPPFAMELPRRAFASVKVGPLVAAFVALQTARQCAPWRLQPCWDADRTSVPLSVKTSPTVACCRQIRERKHSRRKRAACCNAACCVLRALCTHGVRKWVKHLHCTCCYALVRVCWLRGQLSL